MQNLFDIVKLNLFSLLAAPNRAIYFRALMVLRECYQRELNFRRSDLVTYLISQMERDLSAWTEDELPGQADWASDASSELAATQDRALDGNSNGTIRTPEMVPVQDGAHKSALWGVVVDAGQEDDAGGASELDYNTLSGKAHALVRRLIETGWLQSHPDATGFGETLIVPRYASILLDAFYSIVEPVQQRYNAFVYSVYSNLRTANDERDEFMYQALQSAYDSTVALRDSLRALLDDIHSYYQNLHLRQEVRELLAEHFDGYQLSVAIATYHPLKTFDSVYRFRPRILQILREWLTLPSLLHGMATSLCKQRPELDEVTARGEVVRLIQFIMDTFESLDDLLKEIDKRNASYNRASVERLQYLLNTDRDVKGKLVQLLRALPPLQSQSPAPLVEAMRELPIYEVRYLDPDGLYTEPIRRKRGQPQPLRRRSTEDDAAFRAEAQELLERMNALFSQQRIAEFILSQMGEGGRLSADQLRLAEFDDFLRVIVAFIKSDEREMPYEIVLDKETGTVVVNGYRIPAMTFLRKEQDAWTGTRTTAR
jgi:hypothetical protein